MPSHLPQAGLGDTSAHPGLLHAGQCVPWIARDAALLTSQGVWILRPETENHSPTRRLEVQQLRGPKAQPSSFSDGTVVAQPGSAPARNRPAHCPCLGASAERTWLQWDHSQPGPGGVRVSIGGTEEPQYWLGPGVRLQLCRNLHHHRATQILLSKVVRTEGRSAGASQTLHPLIFLPHLPPAPPFTS